MTDVRKVSACVRNPIPLRDFGFGGHGCTDRKRTNRTNSEIRTGSDRSAESGASRVSLPLKKAIRTSCASFCYVPCQLIPHGSVRAMKEAGKTARITAVIRLQSPEMTLSARGKRYA